jgi:hypothetical protein
VLSAKDQHARRAQRPTLFLSSLEKHHPQIA